MSAPEIKLGLVANIFTRMMHFANVGDIEQGHTHDHDHVTLLSSGSLEVTVDNIATEFNAPQLIFISQGKKHQLKALSANTVAVCVHALRDDDGMVLSPDMVPQQGEELSRVLKATRNREDGAV